MGIVKRPSGEAAAKAQAGQIIGKGERAKEDRARGEREQARAQQMAAQQQARQMAQEWDVQKMLLNSQQDQAHEMRMRQADLDGEARAKEWEVEKMELHSKFDFEQDEKERIRRKAEYTAGSDSLKNNKNLTDAQRVQGQFLLSMQFSDLSEAAWGLGLKPQKEDDIISKLKKLQEEKTSAGKTPRTLPPTIAEVEQAATNREAFVKNKKTNAYATISIDEARKVTPEDEWELVKSPIVPEKRGLSKEEKLELRAKMFGGFYF